MLLAFSGISSCYFPSDFIADLQIGQEGRYRFTYVGKITDLSMAQRIISGELEGLEVQKRVEITERDLRRDKSFKDIVYEGKARFDVKYQREGYIVGDRSFNFIQPNSRFLTLTYNKNTGEITMTGGKPNKKHADTLEEADLKFNGTLRIWTNAQPNKHNSKQVEPRGRLIVYSWDIKDTRQRVPIFRFKPQPLQ